MYLNTARLTVTVEAVPWDTFLTQLESGNFDLYYGECRLTADWDLTALLSTEGSLNYGGWSDETTDRLLQAYRSNGADANLVALWQQLLDTAPFAPICFKSVSVVTTEGVVQGLSPTETAPSPPGQLVRPAGRIKRSVCHVTSHQAGAGGVAEKSCCWKSPCIRSLSVTSPMTAASTA